MAIPQLYNLLPLLLLSIPPVSPIDIRYSSPVCASTGGTLNLDCGGMSFPRVAIRDIFIGRDHEGSCGWTPADAIGCEEDSDQALQRKYDIMQKCDLKDRCDYDVDSISPLQCANSIIRVEYYCWEDLQGTGFVLTSYSGETACRSLDDNVVDCPSGRTIKLGPLRANLYSDGSCSGTPSCELWTRNSPALFTAAANCMDQTTCSLDRTLDAGDGTDIGCGIDLDSVNSLQVTSLDFICEGTFGDEQAKQRSGDACVGMSDGAHAVTLEGQGEGTKCYNRYTQCSGGAIGTIQQCGSGQLFDEISQQCQAISSSACSVPVPDNLDATPLSSSRIELSWDVSGGDVEDVDEFVLSDGVTAEKTTGSQTFIFQNLQPNTEYTLSVYARESTFQSQTVETTSTTYPIDPEFTVSNPTEGSLTLSWTFAASSADILNVDYAPTGSPGDTTSIQIPNQGGQYEVDGLDPATSYVFTMRTSGTDSGLDSINQSEEQATTLPSPVTELILSNMDTTDMIHAQWSHAGNSDNFRVTVYDGDNELTSFLQRATEANITNLTPGKTYRVEVVTVFSNLDSQVTSESQLTYPDRGSVSVASQTDSSLTVSWNYEGVASQVRLVLQPGTAEEQTEVKLAAETSHTFQRLLSASEYRVQLIVVSSSLTSLPPRAEISSVFTRPSAPAGLRFTPLNETAIQVFWNPVPRAESYSHDVNVGSVQTQDDDSIVISGVEPAVEYELSVRAVANGLQSDLSSITVHSLPAAPYDLVVGDRSSGTNAILSWKQDGNFDVFIVTAENLDELESSVYETDRTEIEIRGLVPGDDYRFTVVAEFSGYSSEHSASVDHEMECILSPRKWHEGKAGGWMIFLIVYSVILTVLFIILLVLLILMCLGGSPQCGNCFKKRPHLAGSFRQKYIVTNDPSQPRQHPMYTSRADPPPYNPAQNGRSAVAETPSYEISREEPYRPPPPPAQGTANHGYESEEDEGTYSPHGSYNPDASAQNPTFTISSDAAQRYSDDEY